MMLPSNKTRGITLLEVLIVVTIVGLLAAIAYPNYRDFVARAKRTEAKVILMEIATNQERFYLNANRFGSLTDLGYVEPLITESGAYTITIPASTADNFTITATYNYTGGENDRCASFSLDGRGNKTFTGKLDNCWTD